MMAYFHKTMENRMAVPQKSKKRITIRCSNFNFWVHEAEPKGLLLAMGTEATGRTGSDSAAETRYTEVAFTAREKPGGGVGGV